MLSNYIKLAIRNIWKQKFFSTINIAGLSIGIAATIVILLWIRYETSFDNFHQYRDDLFQVMENQRYEGNEINSVQATPAPLATSLKSELPEFIYTARTSWQNWHVFHYGEKHIEESGLYVDPDFLNMFSFPLIKGNGKAFNEPNTILISEKLSKKYFGSQNPLNKMIRIDEDRNYVIRGVFKDVPSNSTLQFDFLMPMVDYVRIFMNNNEEWGNNNVKTYALLKPQANRKALTASIKNFLSVHTKDQQQVTLFLHPIKDWYLRSQFENGRSVGGRIAYVRLFGFVALFILLIACINFMNLTTAQSARRGREVGIRKVMGSSRYALIRQFLGESLILTLIAGLLSMLLVRLALPLVNQVLNKELALRFDDPVYIFIYSGLILLTGLAAGSYPALVLSSFRPVRVLKGIHDYSTSRSPWFWKCLLIVQFVISVVIIASTLVVVKQIEYIRTKNLGYNRDNLIYFSSAGIPPEKYGSFKQQLLSIPGVKYATRTSINFTGSNNSTSEVTWNGKNAHEKVLFDVVHVDADFIPTLDIKMKEGRSFSSSNLSDSFNFIINAEAARRMHLKSPVVGQPIDVSGNKGTILGVTEDFHITSIHEPIQPVIIRPYAWTWTFFLRIDGTNTPAVLRNVEAKYKSVLPDRPFSAYFMDQQYEEMYTSELQVNVLAKWFSVLAIFISCLGLFGLISFHAVARTKEIGIRKVLGASVVSIVALLSKEFLKLVVLASLIAFPLAGWLMSNWLQDFAYHISIPTSIYFISGGVITLIALLTLSIQAIKSAKANPVRNLRSE